METSAKASVGVIGLGIIGTRVASLLRREGHPVSVWSRSPKPEPSFLSSASEVAEAADTLQIFVRDGTALLDVLRAIAPSLGPTHVVLNHATVEPSETFEAERIVRGRGAAFLDAPFTGSRDAAAAAQLVYYVGGTEADLDRALPLLKVSAKTILHMGPVGAATHVKIATNMISAAQVGALAEALALLERAEVPLSWLGEALEHNVAYSGVIAAKLPLMLSGDFAPRFTVSNMLKDLRIALSCAKGTAGPDGKGMDLPVTSAMAGALLGAMQSGWGNEDFAAVARHYSFAGSLGVGALPPSSESSDASATKDLPEKPARKKSGDKSPSKSPERGGILAWFSRPAQDPS